jgi:hypothetical protein
MRGTTKTCLLVCTCCLVALRALAEREPFDKEEELVYEDLDSAEFADEAAGKEGETEASGPFARLEVLLGRELEPEAEMLPAHYEGVKPPGVDHMEMVDKGKRSRAGGSRRGFAED